MHFIYTLIIYVFIHMTKYSFQYKEIFTDSTYKILRWKNYARIIILRIKYDMFFTYTVLARNVLKIF